MKSARCFSVAHDRRSGSACGGVLDGAVHPFDLSVRPGMLELCEPVLDAVLVAGPVEDMVEGVSVAGLIGELNTAVRQHRVDGAVHGCD